MIARKGERRSIDSSEAAELHRELFTVLAHDLGGVAAAISLRVDAVAAAIPPADHAALRTLSEQVRDVNRLLRILRGTVGESTLAPSRRMTVDEWWGFTSRLTTSVLPKGVRIDASFSSAQLSFDQASALTYIWLAACKDLASQGLQPGMSVIVRQAAGNDSATETNLEAALSKAEGPAPKRSPARSRWQRFATRLASHQHFRVTWWNQDDDGITRWRCSLGAGEPTRADKNP